MAEAELSPTMRDYLAEVYRLTDRGEGQPDDYVGTSALADRLDVSAPAVNRMISKLKDSGLLEHEPYQGIRLTDSGRQEALKELRRHRIAEVFLEKVMGFQWHEIHAEAEQLTHGMNDALLQRMNEMAGQPEFCPHGEPIPDENGVLPPIHDSLLSDAPHDQDLQITRVRTREADRLEYMAALGLLPGAIVRVIHTAPFNGPMQLKLGREFRIIGHNLAELIRVRLTE